MKEISTTITQRGQVTIPAEVRRLLGAKPRDKVVFRIEGACVTLAAAPFNLEFAFGSVKPLNRPEDYKKQSQIAREDTIARVENPSSPQ